MGCVNESAPLAQPSGPTELDEIELDGKIYVAEEVEDCSNCNGCAFLSQVGVCVEYACCPSGREDGRYVIFVEKKEEVRVNKEENNTEEKKEEFKLSDSMKIWCATKEYATKVQEKLSSMGCKWSSSGNTRVWHPTGESEYAIYCRNGKLTYDETREYFEDQEIDEYILEAHLLDPLTTCFVKIPKENEDVIGADSISPDSFDVVEDKVNECAGIKQDDDSLDCLFNQIVLLQKETDALSEQKEQIVNKISAKTVAINILKEKMLELISQVGLVFVGEDKADVVKDEEPSDITDWRDLKIGDIVNVYGEDSRVCEVEPEDYDGYYAFAVGCTEEWVDTSREKWHFVSRPK